MKVGKPLVLLWHGVDPDDILPQHRDSSNPTTSLLRAQLEFIHNHYTPMHIADFVSMLEGTNDRRSYAKPPVLLTFDDGLRSVIDYALPLLNEFKAPASFFVIGEVLRNASFVPWFVEVKHMLRRTPRRSASYGGLSVDLSKPESRRTIICRFETSYRTGKSDSDRQECLNDLAKQLGVNRPTPADLDANERFVTKEDLARIEPGSMLTVCSHAMTHRHLDTLSHREQRFELESSALLLKENCSSYYPAIAYPSGSFNTDTLAIAQRFYKVGFAVFLASSYRNRYAYPRIGIGGERIDGLSYVLSPTRLKFLLPVKRFLHVTGLRKAS